MMARTPMHRTSTLIDPESLKQRPVSQRFDSAPDAQGLSRKLSRRKTLINFDDEIPGAPRGLLGVDHGLGGAPGQTKSVFGVDTLWERELAKLREIEEREKADEEERKRREEEEGPAGRRKKGKGKRKGKDRERERERTNTSTSPGLSPGGTPAPENRLSASPVSPVSSVSPINKRGALKRPPPPPVEGEDEESEEESDSSSTRQRPTSQVQEENAWNSGSDEERGPRRTTGSGPRYPNLPPRLLALQSQGQLHLDSEDDSEEDLPLVATIGRAAQRATRLMANDDSSDEDKPLTAILDKKLKLPPVSVGGGLFNSAQSAASKGEEDEEEDDKPLGLRVSRVLSPSQPLGSAEDEDDKPLGLHPEQMRRSQYNMMANQAAVVQQQQMMMQAQAAAQMHQSMMFGAPSIMSAPFYGPQMGPAMMVPPQIPSTPPPVPDSVKLTRVDKWRHDVAVEGEP